MPRPVTVTAKVASNASEVAELAATYLTDAVLQAVATRGIARIAVSGGSTPRVVFELLADPSAPYLLKIPWQQLQLFWVDERCVPPTHEESNFRMTKAAMLDAVPLPPENIHRMEGELDAKRAELRMIDQGLANTVEDPSVSTSVAPDEFTAVFEGAAEVLEEMVTAESDDEDAG